MRIISLGLILFMPMVSLAWPRQNRAECPNVRVDTAYMSRESNQSGIDPSIDTRFCFAFAASDLLSFTLKKTILPYDVALKYYSDQQSFQDAQAQKNNSKSAPVSLSGGLINGALKSASNKTICTNEKPISESDWMEYSTLIHFVKNMQGSNLCSLGAAKKLGVVMQKILEKSTALEALSELVDQICRDGRTVVPKLGRANDAFAEAKMLMTLEKVKKVLFTRRVPVGVEFDYAVFGAQPGSFHTSVVVGMEYDEPSGNCLLVLKDSYGPKCPDRLPSGIKCEPSTGYRLIPQGALESHFKSATFLQLKGEVDIQF